MHTHARILLAAAGTLLLGGSACARDALSPERGVAAATHVLADREHDDEGSGPGRTVTFEDFAAGIIDGQHDWQATGAAGGIGCAVYDHAIADNAAFVPTPRRHDEFGRRSLRISNAVTSGCYSDQTFSQRSADVAGERGARSRSTDGLTDYAFAGARLRNHFEVEWLVMSAAPQAWQPGLEVVASPARGDDHRMSWVQMADWSDGLAIVFAERSDPAAPGAFQRVTVARGLDRRSAHRIRLTMDFRDGPANDVVRVYVDGALRHVGGSWETYYRLDANGRSNFGGATPVVNRVMFRTGSDTHRGVPGDAAPATRGRGFLIDGVRVSALGAVTTGRDTPAPSRPR
ncbi:MAG: hypothetical protein ACYC3L_07770 [Gemmatimonadaceae bacterium]